MSRSPVKLVILIPNPGHVVTAFLKSLIGLTQSLRSRGIPFMVKTYEFSDIVMSRNYLMSFFLSHDSFTHALFLDCDLSFAPEQVFRLLDFDEDFVIAPYPRRAIRFTDYYANVLANEALPPGSRLDPLTLVARTLNYVVKDVDGPPGTERTRGEFSTCRGGGFGFSLLSRRVPEELVARGLVRDLAVNGRVEIYRDAPRFFDFFGHTVLDEMPAMLGEDESFCRRWVVDAGQDIWMDRKSVISHHGPFTFPGAITWRQGTGPADAEAAMSTRAVQDDA